MASFRVTSASRAVEPGRPSVATQADPSAISFPEALGSAVNTAEMTRAGHGSSSQTHARQQNHAMAEKAAITGSTAGSSNEAAATTAKDADLPSQHRRIHTPGVGATEQAGGAAIPATMLAGASPEPAAQALGPAEDGARDPTSRGDGSVARDEAAGGLATDPTRKAPRSAVNQPNLEEAASPDLPLHKDHDSVAAPSADPPELFLAERSAVSAAGSQVDIGSKGVQGTGIGDNTPTIRTANLAAALSIGPLCAGPSVTSDDSTGPGAAPHLASAVRLLELRDGGATPNIADAPFAQLASRNSADRGQRAALADAATTMTAASTASSTTASASEDLTGSDPGMSDSGRPGSDRSELDPNSDIFGQPLITAARPTSAGDAVRARFGSAPRSSEDHPRAAAPNVLAEVQIAEAKNTVPGMLAAEGSSPSSASSLEPMDLSAQLFHNVMGSVNNGRQEVVLQLHPPELGDLTVRVLVHGHEVSAWFATPQIQVQQAISQAIGQLQTDLGNLGYYLASASVGADAWSPRERDEGTLIPQQRGAADKSSPESSSDGSSVSASSDVSVYV